MDALQSFLSACVQAVLGDKATPGNGVQLEQTVEDQTEAAHRHGTVWHAVHQGDLEELKLLLQRGPCW